MPGHVDSPGRTGPEKLWDTPSSDPRMNSSSEPNLFRDVAVKKNKIMKRR